MFHTSIISTGELWLSALTQVECASVHLPKWSVPRKAQERWGKQLQAFMNTQRQSHHCFSTENVSQHDQMTDELFGSLFGSSLWRAVLVVVGSQRRQWWRRPQTLEEKEERRLTRQINLNRRILICGILFFCIFQKCCWLFCVILHRLLPSVREVQKSIAYPNHNLQSVLLFVVMIFSLQNICWHSLLVLPVSVLLGFKGNPENVMYIFDCSHTETAPSSDNDGQQLPSWPRHSCEHHHPNWLKEVKDIWFLGCEKKVWGLYLSAFTVHGNMRADDLIRAECYAGFGSASFGLCVTILHWHSAREQHPRVQPTLVPNPIHSVCSRDTSPCLVGESYIV